MKMKQIPGIVLSALILFASNAQALDLGVGVKAGSLGAGVDLSIALTQTVNARLSVTSVRIDDQKETITVGDEGNTGEVAANLNFDFGASSILFDWYVFNGTFHLTAGMLKNDGRVQFSGNLLDNIVIDGQALALDDISSNITGSVSAGEDWEPYVGLGWGRKAGKNSGLSVSFEIGVALLDPETDLNATVNGLGTNNLSQSELDTRIASAEQDINEDFDELKFWPVLSLGLNYAF